MQAGNAPANRWCENTPGKFFHFPCAVDTTVKIVRLPNERPGIKYNDI